MGVVILGAAPEVFPVLDDLGFMARKLSPARIALAMQTPHAFLATLIGRGLQHR